MTFSLCRKHRTIPHGRSIRLARRITSALFVLGALASAGYGQTLPILPPANPAKTPSETPKFFPAPYGTIPSPRQPANANFEVLPVAVQQEVPTPKLQPSVEEAEYSLVRTNLPGPQSLFHRESEDRFFERLRKQGKKGPNDLFYLPEEPPVSTISQTQHFYPRIDPITNEPFERHPLLVEPAYVCHGRLYFEQPNFERIGWDFGILQPGIELSIFYYDLVMLPYHSCSDLNCHYECSAGKCLPGDKAPLTVPCERFSVTGAIGEAAAIIGGIYMIPGPWVR
jgi:hypothetical protein